MKNILSGVCLVFSVMASLVSVSCSHKPTVVKSSTEANTPTASAPSAEAALTPTRAQSVLKAGKDSKVKGIVHFTMEDGKMKIETMVEGLKPGPHGFHIHEVGDCSKADFTSAGGHFHIQSETHGSLDSAQRHAGDLGNLIANSNGVAKVVLKVDGLSFQAGPHNIIGRSIIIHKDKDDFKSQPAGNSGARIACGVIQGL